MYLIKIYLDKAKKKASEYSNLFRDSNRAFKDNPLDRFITRWSGQ